MNILYHHRTQGKGVEKVHILNVVLALRRLGHRVDILSPPRVNIDYGKHIHDENKKNNDTKWKTLTIKLPELWFELLEILYNIWAFYKVYAKLFLRRYNLVFERYHFLGFGCIFAAKIRKVKYFVEVNFLSDTPLVRKRTRIIKPIESLIERFVLKNADGVIVVSSYLKDKAIERGVPSERLLLLPNAADPAVFNPSIDCSLLKKNIGLKNERIVGFVGFFYPWHGIELLIDAVPLVSRETDNFKFLLVGDGPTFR